MYSAEQIDRQWMERALDLARRGIGLTAPNPAVGCVLLDAGGDRIGEGWHEYDRRDHAEVAAIKSVMDKHRMAGGTAYVTLEPCNHTGRTGPCSVALIESGVSRVVVATVDPNPMVAGRGIERLCAAGVAVTVGVCEAEAQQIITAFTVWSQTRRPMVAMKVAMTVDGRIAPPPGRAVAGEPFWITGKASRARVHEMRGEADAILTGITTVLADDPLLTDRSGRVRRRPLLRVVVDSQLRMPLTSKMVQTAAEDVVVFTVRSGREPQTTRKAELEAHGVRVVELEAGGDGRVPLDRLLEWLGEEHILTLMTEAGGTLNAALLNAGLVDRLSIFVAPQLLGGEAVAAFAALERPLPLNESTVEMVGEDTLIQTVLRAR